jgi:transcriptional regulator with XRE-family HTH domain
VIAIHATILPHARREFDPAGFAAALSHGRRRLGLSTRELAATAGISQSYVVALEGAARPQARRVVPTVDVIAGLAAALGRPAEELFAAALRVRCRHVLMVVDGAATDTLARARRACGDASVEWVRVVAADHPGHADEWTISLRRDDASTYDPARIAESLRVELAGRPTRVSADNLGLLFEETAAVMSSLEDPHVILDFEDHWAEAVADAAGAANAHATWNVCVYERERLGALDDPVGASLHLLSNHDTVWLARRTSTLVGRTAARRMLLDLQPPGIPARAWSGDVDGMLDSIGLVA